MSNTHTSGLNHGSGTASSRVRRLVLILSFAILAAGMAAAPLQQEGAAVRLVDFDLLTANSGWVLLDRQLFQTADEGQTWTEIGPSIQEGAAVQDVSFIDPSTGWVLWTQAAANGKPDFQLAHTTDGGQTWTIRPLALPDSPEAASRAAKADMGWLDRQTGWISIQEYSGSNFSLGTLFRTSDGGLTWKRSPLPAAEKISFSDSQVGWAVGGPAGDEIFRTEDGGATWQDWRPNHSPAGATVTAYMPVHVEGKGLLVTTSLGSENELRVYTTGDGPDEWRLAHRLRLESEPGLMALSIPNPETLVAIVPGTTSILRLTDGGLDVIASPDGRSASIVELDMVSRDVGWGRSVDSRCSGAPVAAEEFQPVSCTTEARLLRTTDGGLTWEALRLPLVQSDVIRRSFSGSQRTLAPRSGSTRGITEAVIGQGFDKCEIPSLSQLQTWWNSSPYRTVNLYIGGSSRACANSALSLSHIRQIHRQGWNFIPTWVGPQAPCTGFRSRFSSDVETARSEGILEANQAVDRLAELGLTNPDKTGSVVYYDIEYYGTDSACRSAVNAFMDGWVSQVRARGNLAGVYGSTQCNTGLSDFLNITNVPDVIWPARWYHSLGAGYYDPNANVWNLGSCIPNTVWANHQRIRQYEGSHNETWGNLTLEIDSNVLDGVVAIPNLTPYIIGLTRLDPNPTRAATVNFRVTFSEAVTGVDAGDFVLSTTGVSGAFITGVSGSGSSYTVTANTGTGNGTLRLDVPASAGINSPDGYALGWLPFTTGESYTVDKRPLAASLVSPAGDIGTNYRPVYTWNTATDATWYYLWVNGPSGNVIKQWYQASAVCGGGTCSATPATTLGGGNHTWWIQSWNPAGYGPWSTGRNFSTTVPLAPGAATPSSPSGNIGENFTPTYTWSRVSGATWYLLWVNGPSGNVIRQWYDAFDVCGGSTCSATPAVSLGGGEHTWWVQTWNSTAYGPWSSGLTFTTTVPSPPGAATPVSPTGSITDTTPQYTWDRVSDATWYYLWVNGPSGNVIKQWYEAAAVCSASTCSVSPAAELGAGQHTWWVRTWNKAGYGPWSSGMSFALP